VGQEATGKFDIAIIGAGPAGYVGAIRAAQLGARVAIVEKREVGGTCLNRGCIPSKALIHCAELLDEAKGSRRFGIRFGDPEVDIAGVRKHKDRCVKQLVGGVKILLDRDLITVAMGTARLLAPTEIEVTADGDTQRLETQRILIATGSVPLVLPIPGADGEGIITSDDGVDLPGPPERLVIVGAGAVGCEFAYVYSRFGTKVTMLEMLPQIVPTEDADIAEVLASSLSKSGVQINTEARVASIEDRDGGKLVVFERGGETEQVEADMVLLAAGRKAELDDLDLEQVGVEIDRPGIKVDERLKTNTAGIWACGDCIRGIGLAHLSSHEAIVVMEDCFGDGGHINYDAIPGCIFTHPEIGSVGLKEKDAQERGIEVSIGKFPFAAIGKAAAMGAREGFVKIIAAADSGQVLGASVVGPGATELLSELSLAVEMGLTVQDVANTMHSHPTLHEATGEAALAAMGRAIHLP